MIKKKLWKLLISVALCAVLTAVCLCSFSLNAQAAEIIDNGSCGDDLTWTLDSEGVLTISGTGDMEDYGWNSADSKYYYAPWYDVCSSVKKVVIEDGVTSIGDWAFYNCSSLTSVDIPDSVTSIGDWAFYGCSSLTSVTIGDSVTSIGRDAFNSCSSLTGVYISDIAAWCNISFGSYYANPLCYAETLHLNGEIVTDLVIPDSVTDIGNYAFYNCCELTGITIGNGVTSIGDSAFNNCSSLTEITIPDSVTSIGKYAFYYCTSLTSVTIGDSVTSIGAWAFSGCDSLTSVTIPDSVTSIGSYAFSSCDSLTGIWVDENNQYYCSDDQGVLFDKNRTVLIQAPSKISGTYTIPDGVTSIGEYAFSWCDSLKTVTIPESVTSIGSDAFYGCSNLQYNVYNDDQYLGNENNPYYALIKGYNRQVVNIHPDAKIIGSSAFSGCDSLTSVTIPDSVTSIGMSAFSYCTSLTGIWVDENNQYYCSDDQGVLFDKNRTVLIRAPGKISGTYAIPDGVTSIGEYAFSWCDNLTSVKIPESVTSIGDAFYGCSNLQYNVYNDDQYLGNENNPYYGLIKGYNRQVVNIHPDTKIIGPNAFYKCTSLTSVDIPDSVTSIGSWAFYGCSSLTSVDIPDSVTSIGSFAFNSCTKLTNVTLSNSITDIAWSTFGYCESLVSINIPNSVTSIGYEAFYGCDSLTSVDIPDSVTSIAARAFTACGLTSLTIPDSITSILNFTFAYCDNLTSIVIPNSVTSISQRAFCGCGSDSVLTILFKGDAPALDAYTFSNVTATAYYPANNATWTEDKLQNYGGTITWIAYEPVEITTQPKTAYAIIGDTVKTTVQASGDGLTYQWYIKNAGASSYTKSSVKTATYSCKMSDTTNGRYVRCKITDQYGNSVWTNTVRLKSKALAITTQPVSKTVKDGTTAKFSATPNGTNVTYQWQYRTSSSGSWKNASATGNKTKTLSVAATVAKHGYQYRCKVTDSAGNVVYTDVVDLYVLGIKAQPVDKAVKAGATAKLTVSAVGDGLTYQWQYRTSSSGSWKNASATGNKTKTLSVAATVAKHGYQYRCKITDSAGNVVYTKVVNLYVLGIKTQPVSKTVKAGATAKFTVVAVGKGLTYQWQYRTSSSGSWKNVSTASGKTANYSLTAAARHNGYQYRCKITDSAGNVIYTSIVKLTVK